jgi:mannose-1-phosphate guanylyltransferase
MTGDDRPKQFCPVTGDLTLVQETQRRVALELPKEKTVFVLNRLHEAYYSKILCRAATKYRHGTCHSL